MSALFNAVRARLPWSGNQDLELTVRQNLRTELYGSIAYGVFFAMALQFVPVVLRRMGATSDLLALYTALTYVGSILTSLSLVLMRRRRTQTFAVLCWGLARSLFLIFALLNDVAWVLVVMAVFWLLEAFPSPAYTRIMQAIYPAGVRGTVMSIVRLGMVAAVLIVTPMAGWALDHWGYHILFPVAALAGLLSTWYFSRLIVDEGTLPPRQTRPLSDLIAIVRRNRNFAIHLSAFAVFGLGALLGWPLYPIVQVDRLNLSYTQIGLLATAQSVAWLCGFLYWGRVVDRRGGLWVMRVNLLIGTVVPLSYIFATEGWMLLPAFVAQGIISAGVDLGLINTCIQLAEPESVVEYAVIQATVVGVRGMVAPFIGAGMVAVGLPETMIFAIGAGLVLLSWVILGRVEIPLSPEEMRVKRRQLRFRWPVRFRFPRM
jgi:MFS transporter, DHA1 family, inner membrane transport protein